MLGEKRTVVVVDHELSPSQLRREKATGALVLQPGRNTRFGGFAIFRSGIENEGVVRRWKVVVRDAAASA